MLPVLLLASYVFSYLRRNIWLHLAYSIGIRDVVKWTGLFTSNNKMMQSLRSLKKYDDSSVFIYHTDLDEFPDQKMFVKGNKFICIASVVRSLI